MTRMSTAGISRTYPMAVDPPTNAGHETENGATGVGQTIGVAVGCAVAGGICVNCGVRFDTEVQLKAVGNTIGVAVGTGVTVG